MSDIRSSIKTGAIWSTVMAISRVGLQFLSTVVLGHLLSPDDYGLIGMMAIFIAVSETLMDAGLGGALIRKKDASVSDFGTLFTYNICTSVLLYFIIFIISPYVADVYEKPILTTLLRLYGSVLVIESLSFVPKIRLIKGLQLKKYAIIGLVSGVIGLTSSIIMAILGLGVYSLIWQAIIASSVNTILLIIVSHNRFIICFSFQSFKELFTFGFNTTSANLIKNFTENIFTNVVAKVAPLNITGYYNQSFKLQNVVASVQTTIIDNALFPVLSKEEDKRIVDVSLQINYFAAYAVLLIYLFLIFNSHLIVKIMLGNEWIGMVPFFKLLLIGGFFQSITAFNRNIFKTLAETLSIALCEIISLMSVVVLLIAMRYGVYAIVFTFIGYAVFRWQVSLFLLSKKGHVDYMEYMKHLFSILAPIVSASVLLTFFTFFESPILNGIIQSVLLLAFIVSYGEIKRLKEYLIIKQAAINSIKKWK